MAVTANQIVKRQGRDGKIRSAVVASGKTIYEGALVFEDAGGLATDVIVDANTTFLGIARQQKTAGESVECWTDGDFELPVGGTLAAADVGVAVHASDNYTPTKTATGNPKIGVLTKFLTAAIGVVSIRGLGEA